jgi:hypothetical protein
MRAYNQLLPYAFKRFSLAKAVRTALPTAGFFLFPKPLPASTKPALFTMNILPPAMTLWYHLAQKYIGDRADMVIFDSSGLLHKKDFPKARVQKFLNLYAATKSQIFLESIAQNRKIGWLCDDDMYIIDTKAIDIVERELAKPNTASVSFRPRKWWEFEINGKRHPVSSSYSVAINRELFVKENLLLGPCDGNTHPALPGGKDPKRYDTFDKANEILLTKGYDCYVVPDAEQEKYVTGFTGVSGGVVMLWYFTQPDQVLDFFRSAPKERWKGNFLTGLVSSLLCITEIQSLAAEITGSKYPLPSLPSRDALLKLRDEHATLIREDQSYDWIFECSKKLRAAL